MAYARLEDNPLDYKFCRYGKSKTLFRGPKKRLNKPYNVFIGGTETFGKFVDEPFPYLVENMTGLDAVNFGVVNAGIDVFVKDKSVLDVCGQAKTTVIQMMGAQNMSNRFYMVHPRRNDRFLQASDLLRTIYHDVDFTEFSFTSHLLQSLKKISPEKFKIVEFELRDAWTARMSQLIAAIPGRKLLLKLSDRRGKPGDIWAAPMFVTDDMINDLRDRVCDVLAVDVTDDILPHGVHGRCVPTLGSAVAAGLPGPDFHTHVAKRLTQIV